MTLLLVIGATLRLTRFITSDSLGHWLFVRPAREWALGNAKRAEYGNEDVDVIWDDLDPVVEGKRVKLVSGLDCPFCVGFWIGGVVLVASLIPGLRPLFRLVTGALALNYLTAHISARLD